MTNQEFENEFDILYNNIMSNQAPGLDSYEKSVFLTNAQEQLILSYYNGKNSYNESFERTEEIRRYLSSLVKTKNQNILFGYLYNGAFFYDEEHTSQIATEEGSVYIHIPTHESFLCELDTDTGTYVYTDISAERIEDSSIVLPLPERLWFITYEAASFSGSQGDCASGKRANVVPVTQDALDRTIEDPFKNAGLRRVLRLDIGNNKVELISKYKIANYIVRYLEFISPIILTNLDNDLSINGVSTETSCSLPEGLHRAVLELAVKLASAAYKNTIEN